MTVPNPLGSVSKSASGVVRRWQSAAKNFGITLARRLGARAFLVLAALFSLVIVIDPGISSLIAAAETRLFDLLITQRIVKPAADPDIVIIDIDEASLAAMAAKHGRWPWPNNVMGELVTHLEKQQPRAIVFDILFSDRDTLRPKSDKQFNAAIAASHTTFFPILRLDPQNDHLSRIRPGMLPGATALSATPDQEATIAMILPKVPAALDNGRLGTHQVKPDKDGVIRRYPAWLEHAGWKIPALPQRIADEFGFPGSPQQEVLLNWRGPPFSYRYVSFSDVFNDITGKATRRPPDEFKNKIILIGSTAPSLFDVKGTPMARIHPGVEILATAIDNFKHGDWLHERPAWLMKIATLILIWAMAIALSKQIRIDVFDTVFAALQGTLILVAFITLNTTHWYLDTSAPLSLGVMYFTVARVYHGLSLRWLADGSATELESLPAASRTLAVMAIHLSDASTAERRLLKGQLDRLIARSTLGAGRIAYLIEDPGFARDAFADVMLMHWLLLDPEENWIPEATAFQAHLAAFQPKRHWHRRLKFGCHQATINWTTPGGWAAPARTVVLTAINNAVNTLQETET